MGRDDIKILSEREQCREKVSIWFGSRDNFIHPFKEVLANAIDEISNNFESGEVTIHLSKDKVISITDTGRGIPLDGETNGVKNYELLFLKLFAGTNYENANNGKITTGTNGCGNTVICYCSSFLNIESYRKDKIAKISFKDGGVISSPLQVLKNKSDFTGTKISFKLDRLVFGDYEYNIEEIKDIIKNSAGVSNKIKFTFQYEDDEPVIYHYEDMKIFFEEETSNRTCNLIIGSEKKVINTVETSEETQVQEVDYMNLILSTSSEPVHKSFLNITHLSNGGAINDGVVFGVREFVNKYATDKKMLDKKMGIVSNNDVRDSISFVCNVLSTFAEYANQTKLSTSKSLYQRIVWKYTVEVLEIELIENPKNIEKLVKHILEVQKFNSNSQAARKRLKSKLNERVDNLLNRIQKLTDCKIHGEEAELFISEGDSAKGSIILARDANFQACIAIRGKIMNTLKKSFVKILESQTVLDIIRSLGCGVEIGKKNKDLGEFNIKALRYGKIIIATDADVDGLQIQCLLLALFYRLTPTLIKEGKIYIALTPLYEVRLVNDKSIYWFTEKEKEEYISENGYSEISHISRCKGLGEMDAKIMSETGVNPETRNIIRVTMEDAEKMNEMFEIWMDDDSEKRKEILNTELNKFDVMD